jgi:membrane fusion protein (multidrug efflux system)
MSQDKAQHDNAGPQDPAKPGRQSGNFKPKGRAKWIAGIVLLICALAGFFIYEKYFANRESTDDAQIDGHINPVAAKVSGHVLAIKIKDNQFVKTGTILVEIDSKDYKVALERARADLAAAKASAESAHTEVPMIDTTTNSQSNLADAGIEQAQSARAVAMKDVETARARLEVARAKVRENEATHTKAVQDLERMKLLIAKDEISKQQYDAAVAQADATRAARDSAQAGVAEILKTIEAAQARVSQADAGIKEAQANLEATRAGKQQRAIGRSNALTALARVKQAEAILEQAELTMQYTEVRAPIDGIVSQRKVELGQYVQIGQPLLALVPLHNVWVTANYKENQLKDMRPGQKAVISVDAYGGREYRGHVDSIAAATGARFSLLPPENATGNYVKVVQRVPVKIIFDEETDETHPLRPGLSVVSTVFTEER